MQPERTLRGLLATGPMCDIQFMRSGRLHARRIAGNLQASRRRERGRLMVALSPQGIDQPTRTLGKEAFRRSEDSFNPLARVAPSLGKATLRIARAGSNTALPTPACIAEP